MAVWLIRAGSDGEFEAKFPKENRDYVIRGTLDVDLLKMKDRPELVDAMSQRRYPR